jgi:hypothetical protein
MLIPFQAFYTEAIRLFILLFDLILTALIVYIYWNLKDTQNSQTKILENQTEIMENQEAFMEAQFQPILNLSNFEIINHNGREMFEFQVRNHGNSIIRSALLKTRIYVTPEEPATDEALMMTKEEGGSRILLSKATDITDTGGASGLTKKPDSGERMYFPPSSETVTAYGRFSYSFYFEDEYHEYEFPELLEFLQQIGYDILTFQWFIIYTNMAGNEYTEYVTTADVPLAKTHSLKQAVEEWESAPIFDKEDEILKMTTPFDD